MKYRYIRAEMRWIREADIPQGVKYGGYEDPHPSDPDEPFNAREYLDYNFTYLHGDANEDHGVTPGNDEVHQEILAPQAPQPTPQPFPHAYIPQTYYGMPPPPDMPPYAIYLFAHMHDMALYEGRRSLVVSFLDEPSLPSLTDLNLH
ncbi:hypothetical protein Scep_028203 [Stephania cephalantha]|uniref:Uncharacterized protein n=1 Tax=Stephania cephalantha TaxID=152367 RepID=A0AAP0E9H5_9MAGN